MSGILTSVTSHPNKLERAEYAFSVTGQNGVCTSALIQPTSLTPRLVSGVVEWQDPICMSSLVSTEGDASAWLQRLFLVYAAAGPTSIRYVPELAAQSWATFWATFPDPNGEALDQVRIILEKVTWEATFASSDLKRMTVKLPISEDLRELDAGSVLYEMALRLSRPHSLPTK